PGPPSTEDGHREVSGDDGDRVETELVDGRRPGAQNNCDTERRDGEKGLHGDDRVQPAGIVGSDTPGEKTDDEQNPYDDQRGSFADRAGGAQGGWVGTSHRR